MKDAIRYVVTVTAVVERVEKAGREWQKTSAAPDAPYDYTPETEKTVQREVDVYQQHVDTLDLAKLVAVVNEPAQVGNAPYTMQDLARFRQTYDIFAQGKEP